MGGFLYGLITWIAARLAFSFPLVRRRPSLAFLMGLIAGFGALFAVLAPYFRQCGPCYSVPMPIFEVIGIIVGATLGSRHRQADSQEP